MRKVVSLIAIVSLLAVATVVVYAHERAKVPTVSRPFIVPAVIDADRMDNIANAGQLLQQSNGNGQPVDADRALLTGREQTSSEVRDPHAFIGQLSRRLAPVIYPAGHSWSVGGIE